MQELTKAQKGRFAIKAFKTTADALAMRGYYNPSGRSGHSLTNALKMLSPEIYGTMNDPRSIEINGLAYVLERLPRGIEACSRIVFTAQEELEKTSFEKIQPPKRRRTSYRISDKEMCFAITRGASEIYDLMTHLTFLNNEAHKIYTQRTDAAGHIINEWRQLENTVKTKTAMSPHELDQAIWNLSILLGRTYRQTRDIYEILEASRDKWDSNSGLFNIIYQLGTRIANEKDPAHPEPLIYFTPSIRDMIGHHQYSRDWAKTIKDKLYDLGFQGRPIHIISANMHSVMTLLYGFGAEHASGTPAHIGQEDIYEFVRDLRDKTPMIKTFAEQHGLIEMSDNTGAQIDCQIIDTSFLHTVKTHQGLDIHALPSAKEKMPVLLVIDYAFGAQAFEVMDELLDPQEHYQDCLENILSISIMGKAGILTGQKGDLMLATAHVNEGTPHNYRFTNDLTKEDFDSSLDVYVGPMVTVLGTSLQNKDVLEKFQKSSWQAIGLEMEGSHYQRAISGAIIRGHISEDVKVRYAYYASDNPLVSGQTLASGSMGIEGIRPTYMITKRIIEKILDTHRMLQKEESPPKASTT